MRQRLRAMFAVLLALSLAAAALAADGYNADIFYPTPFAGRYLTFEDAQTLPQFRWAAGGVLDYANAPVEVRTDNRRSGGVLDSVLTSTLTGAFSVHDMLNFGAQMPIFWWYRGRSLGDLAYGTGATVRENATSMGDIHFLAKVRAIEEGVWPFGLAITPFVTFPTGDASRLLGEDRFTGGLTVTYEIDLAWLRMALDGGWHYRGPSRVLGTRVDNSFPIAAGLSRNVIDPLNLSLEAHGEIYDSSDNRRFAGDPFELDLVARYSYDKNLRIFGGGGAGLTSGAGSPAFRIFAGVDFQPKPTAVPPPSSGSLRVTVQDKTGKPLEAEVGLEGPELRVGNTVDGAFALSGLAPGDYQIRVSRPDYETGKAEAAVFAGQAAAVTVVLEPLETRLTIVALDKDKNTRVAGRIIFNAGTAKERVADNPSGDYTLRVDPGPVNFTVDAPGYEAIMTTATAEPHVMTTVTVPLRRKIQQIGKIFFDFNSAKLRPESAPTLRDVVRQIKEIKPQRVIIEGHCSDEGTHEYNMKLSKARAESVRDFLVKNGAPAGVFEVMAYGAVRPIASNETDEGRERNRRVEFIIEGE